MNPGIRSAIAAHDARIRIHYDHARKRHPYFCDIITCLRSADTHLSICRKILAAELEAEVVDAGVLLDCEFYEAMQAYANGDTARAVEECYDAIVVLLRIIDVLEGRQKLGRIKAEGGAK